MTGFNWSQLAVVWPEIFLAAAAMLLLVIGVFRKNDCTACTSRCAILCFIGTAAAVFMAGWYGPAVLNGAFILDPFSGFLKILILFGLAAVTALSGRYLEDERMARFEYPVLVMLAGVGMMLMVSANNMLTLYMGLELQSLSLYVLAAIRRDDAKSSEAGLKYFVLGALASGMLLFGISFVYGHTGSISFTAISNALQTDGGVSTGLTLGMVFVLAALALKISAVPFHMWTPDVYEGAPTPVTALFAMVPKIAAIGLIVRLVFGPFGAVTDDWQQILWFLAAASMAWGAFAALGQDNIKRLMAYSSIGNMGYALVGVVAASAGGVTAVIVYMTIYLVMSAGVFGVILAMRRDGVALEKISDLAGLSRTRPMLAYTMAFLMFSMSGIPPMAGFFGKLMVFESAVAGGFYVLAVLGVLSSVVAAYYYLRIIKVMFFDEPAGSYDAASSLGMKIVMTASILFTIFFILSPDFLISTSRAAAQSLFPG